MKINTGLRQKADKTEAGLAAREADIAESDAAHALDIAISALEEAEGMLLYASYARKHAEENA